MLGLLRTIPMPARTSLAIQQPVKATVVVTAEWGSPEVELITIPNFRYLLWLSPALRVTVSQGTGHRLVPKWMYYTAFGTNRTLYCHS